MVAALFPESRSTIFARATGSLPSAIAIIRCSGQAAAATLEKLTRRVKPLARRAVVRRLYCPATGAVLDEALILWMPGPATVTGEDLVEFHLHGGPAVVASVERALSALPGLQRAEAGAFTRRAFENGRLDLTQVEGLAALLSADTEQQRVHALMLAEGGLRREVERWQNILLDMSAQAEAVLDFGDDEGDGDDTVVPALHVAAGDLTDIIDTALRAPPIERLRDGVRIAIAGPPNAGKSSLLNALAGRDVSIATPIAGTTRDIIELSLALGDVPIILSDMAGLRGSATDPIEQIGIEKARQAIQRADILLWLGADEETPGHPRVLRVKTKSDLLNVALAPFDGHYFTSAKTGQGIAALKLALLDKARAVLPSLGQINLTSAQRERVEQACSALDRISTTSDILVIAEELRLAALIIGEITHGGGVEQMLDALFAKFCIGK